jgi:hypothetical protein
LVDINNFKLPTVESSSIASPVDVKFGKGYKFVEGMYTKTIHDVEFP